MSGVLDRLRTLSARAVRSPLAWILVVVFLLHVVPITWGLPASDGWDDDGVAPRDFLVGVVQSFTPGDFYTYPPVHLVLLALLGAPVTLLAFLHASSHAPADLVREFIRVPYMTTFALIARSVSVAMSLGIVWALARIGEAIGGHAGRRTGAWVAAAAAVNAAFAYYSHTTNLDVPSLFWSSFALLATCEAILRAEPARLRRVALFAALAIGTKDQAYALFLLALPLALVTWLVMETRVARGRVLREIGLASALGGGLLLLVDGALTNPSGFRRRIDFLLGAASQDHAFYARSFVGTLHVLHDAFFRYESFYPWVFAPVLLVGLVVAAGGGRSARPPDGHAPSSPVAPLAQARLAALVPLLAMISFTVAFDCTARRTEERFVMPQYLLASIYIGLGWAALERACARAPRAFLAAASGAFALALHGVLTVDANMLFDPRYDAEEWLRAHARPGDTIEIYGNNVYQPRFPPEARVERVGDTPLATRNPLPGVEELEAPYADAPHRAPRFIVVSDGWVWRYLLPPDAFTADGHVITGVARAAQADVRSCDYFRALEGGALGYHRAHESVFESRYFPPYDIHASTARHVRIFERTAP